MNKLLKTGLIAVTALLLSGFVYLATQRSATKPAVEGITAANLEEVSVRIAEVNFDTKIKYQPDMTALEATKIATKGEMITSGEGTDAFVLEILGKTADKFDREFWELLVNNESALMGAGNLKLKAGDSIEWKVSKF